MAAVPLKFAPPTDPDIVTLHIEEAPDSIGPYVEKAFVAAGTYPDYISEYTLTSAVSAVDWFRIRWADVGGAFTPYSQPMQGGTESLVSKIKDRVMQRDPTLVDAIVYQEAEAAIADYFSTNTPYDPALAGANYRVLSGLTYLVLARSLMVRAIQTQISGGSTEGFTVGLVSVKSGTSGMSVDQVRKSVEDLLDLANADLGLSKSVVLVMDELYQSRHLSSYDHSRLIGWVGLE